MRRNTTTLIAIAMLFLLAGCGGGGQGNTASMGTGAVPTAGQVKDDTVARVESATTVLASDQHVFRFDGESSRTFTKCEGAVCGISTTPEGLDGGLARAFGDPTRFDFGSKHFAARLKDSLTLKPHIETIRGVQLVEGFGLRTGERAFSARFYGGWLDEGAFFVNRTTLTIRNERGMPIGLGDVFDSSALGMASTTAPMTRQDMSATWEGVMLGVDVSDNVTRGQFVRGDVTIDIHDLTNPDVDVTFDNLQDHETGASLDGRNISPWENVPIQGGAFGEKPTGSNDYIQGHFVG